MLDEFRRSEVSLQGGFAFAVVDDRAEASFHAPEAWPLLRDHLPLNQRAGEKPTAFEFLGKTYVMGLAKASPNGQILVAMPLPANYSSALGARLASAEAPLSRGSITE